MSLHRLDPDNDIVILLEDLHILEKIIPEIIENWFKPISYCSFLEFKFIGENDYIDVRLRPKSRFNKTLDKINFLNTEFCIPNNVDEYLTILYGNWRIPSFKHSWTVPK